MASKSKQEQLRWTRNVYHVQGYLHICYSFSRWLVSLTSLVRFSIGALRCQGRNCWRWDER